MFSEPVHVKIMLRTSCFYDPIEQYIVVLIMKKKNSIKDL